LHEIYAAPKSTQKLLDDSSINVESWLVDHVADKFGRTENTAFVNGNGVGKPRGFLTYPVSTDADDVRAWGTMEYTPSGASGAFASSDPGDALIDLQYSLNSGYRPSAVWLMNRAVAGEVRKFKDTQGRYMWADGLQPGQPPSLLGHSVILAEDMPDLAADSLSVAFGDFRRGYIIADRHEMRVLRDPYSDKPFTIFYTYKRCGADVANYECIKILKMAAS